MRAFKYRVLSKRYWPMPHALTVSVDVIEILAINMETIFESSVAGLLEKSHIVLLAGRTNSTRQRLTGWRQAGGKWWERPVRSPVELVRSRAVEAGSGASRRGLIPPPVSSLTYIWRRRVSRCSPCPERSARVSNKPILRQRKFLEYCN